jgi:taurine dioxygenase
MVNFDAPPQFSLPPTIDMDQPNPFGTGVFIGAGIGYRWDDNIHMQN